ncbi:hypothetical protein [uncultured Paracoccus sp.]|uniref:hypothetical protein n=1 Tax=uncultured Paracoccus sp. TaxID=189685 RepID=UPI00260AA2B4|nr:hypothetical protein [uncultured Paracoccus sp.]
MGIFSNWSGGDSRRDLKRGAATAQGRFDQAGQTYGQQYATAQGRFAPYAETGQKANSLYSDFLGLNGQPAQRTAYGNYQESPYADFDRDRITSANARSMNARGLGGSGVEALASARALREYGTQGMETYLNRLQGMQGQGLGIANTLAGLDTGYGTAMGGLEGQRAGLDTQLASALASTRSMGLQNTLGAISGLGGLALGGMTPGAGGLSAFGNIAKMAGGVNSLFAPSSAPMYDQGR